MDAKAATSLLARHHQGLRKNGRWVLCSIRQKRMFAEGVETRRKHHTLLCRTRKDVAAFLRTAIKPVGVVERACAQTENVRKSFHIQIQCRPASAAEVQADAHLAGIRSVMIRAHGISGEDDVFSPEYRLDEKRGACELLAKSAMTDRHAYRFGGGRPVTNVAAEATTLMNDGH